ncbi:MAG: hypothetical protein H6662_06560 [Ardenticatenaceae bacterium]|nr:hypothetical protein [Anaerolineales bacterium]MCB8921226.1 hypothetical protein [Ardenticatenaceae bacterium]MCB8990592.1 hypothetical protein [Ardenticatenaceae bacterium]MCB9004299.1 hypothetical protein [Ardenticatenaceae bacterium]
MKRFILLVLVIVLLAACTAQPQTGTAPTPVPTAVEVNVQATIDTAVAATAAADANMNATIEAAVDSALEEATAAATPVPVDTTTYVTMTEDELAAAIDQAVAEAVTATNTTGEAAANATADGAITTEEVQTIEVYVSGAEEAVALAEELIDLYYAQYGELATETLTLLVALEEDLSTLNTTLDTINGVLVGMNETLTAGMELSEELYQALADSAAAAQTAVANAQIQSDAWQAAVETAVTNRQAAIAQISAQIVAADLPATLTQVQGYAETVRTAIADQNLSMSELQAIGQQSANAIASIQANGGPQLQNLAGSIESLTAVLAGGGLSQAQAALGNLESLIPSLPSLPRP